MSMIMYFVAVTEDEFNQAKADDELAGTLLAREDAVDVDYRTISAAVEGMAEVEGSDETEPSFGEEGSLGFEGNYGPAMYWSPATIKDLEASNGWEMAVQIEPALEKLLASAKDGKRYVLAVVD
jgi:hypothetical protein